MLYKSTLTSVGTRMSSSGNFSVSREHLKEKALHALFSLRWHTNLSKLKAALACKIFDTMISPILTYNLKFGVCMPNQILRQGAHICLAPSQNSNVWRPNIHVWTHFEAIFPLRVQGWIRTTVSQIAGVRGCRRKRQSSLLYNVFILM